MPRQLENAARNAGRKSIAKSKRLGKWVAGGASVLAAAAMANEAPAQSTYSPLLERLIQKGFLTEQEARTVSAQVQTNRATPADSKWKLSDSIKSISLFGDARFRYEYRGATNPKQADLTTGNIYYRERFRYAFRAGIRGDLYDNFNFGIRIETSSNPRSQFVTLADDSNPTPSAKNSDTVAIGQVYVGWKPADWYEMTVGKMPMPLYTTPMVWSPSISPEGAFEKFNYSSHGVEVFADFGQFMYQDTNPDVAIPSSDTALLAWQIGVNAHFNKSMSVKMAPTLYTYAGEGSGNGLPGPFIGQGSPSGQNQAGGSFIYNQTGINDLRVFELPTEYNFKIAGLNAKAFGDFAVNLEGNQRAKAATLVGFKKQTDEDKAYQAGLSIGTNPGLVYGATSKRGTWEARGYWQHVEQYALDVNLTDADFFEGRGNLEGAYGAIAYSFTDAIIGTVRYGYAQRINKSLGTGGSNSDLAPLNPVNNYHLVQLDFTWRF